MIKYNTLVLVSLTAMMMIRVTPVQAEQTLPAPLEDALQDAEARSASSEDVRFYFQRKIVRFGEVFLIKSYNPAGPEGQQWAIAYPDAEKDPAGHRKQVHKHARKKDGSDLNLLMPPLRARLADGVTLESESDDETVYSFKIADEYYVSGEGKGANIAKYMDGKLAVGKKDGMIHWVHYVARQSFRPIPIAKVKQFDIYQEFSPAWYGGPMVKVLEKNKVSGTAIIRKIKFDDVVTNYDFRPIPK
ncbi:MAG: hypothetical protein COA84_15270 [Robiginitomaculum sp.]|nr:MAG: hypothetical protein COA84_15270 [Robiginitomaculum sp.]